MKKTLFFLICINLAAISAFSQPYAFKQSTGNSGTGANIDVKYHRFTWNINPDNSKRISGNVTTYFVTTQNDVSQITFDFIKSSFDNSNLKVYYHGTAVSTSFPSTDNVNILQINLPSALSQGILDSVTIFYDGVPPPVNGQEEGCQQVNVAGYPLFFTLSESYEDRNWWPCKADMQDKIDSTDFFVTTPSKYRAAANGVLVSENALGGNTTYHFRHRYPIAS